jgi:hypothetical protein
MNVPLEIMLVICIPMLELIVQENVSFVVDKGLVMLTTVRIVPDWRKTGMDVQRLSIWEVQGRICFMRGESWDKLGLCLVEVKPRLKE